MKYKVLRPIYFYDTLIAKAGETIEMDDSKIELLSRKITNYLPKEYIKSIKRSSIIEPLEVDTEDKVNHPSHYTWLKEKCDIEVIDITRHMDFCLGNSIKYLLRAGHKTEDGYSDKQKQIEDLKKAAWYINDKIKQLEND